MAFDLTNVQKEIADILTQYEVLRAASRYDDCSDQGDVKIAALVTTLAAAIERFAPPGSRYRKSQEETLKQFGPNHAVYLAPLVGILTALRDDIAAGRLASITELIHADVFGDFLEMADYLNGEGYKDPAAVLAGGVLEEQLRKLCDKHSLLTSAAGRPKKADTLNAELAAAGVYSKLDQKNVTAWLGLRNDAAHGNYAAYSAQQVALLIQSIRDFLTRVPA